jgi:hypothetical protein
MATTGPALSPGGSTFPGASGEVHDLFGGYVESWDQEWPGGGWSDAIVTLTCADEFKVLALDSLPTTSPVRDSYDDLIASDNPAGYWQMNERVETNVQSATDVEVNPLEPGGSGFSGGRTRRSHF